MHPLLFSVPSSFLESFRFENAQAGLLTCFRYKHLPGGIPVVNGICLCVSETYSSGTVQDSHLIPFSSSTPGQGWSEPMHGKDTVYI